MSDVVTGGSSGKMHVLTADSLLWTEALQRIHHDAYHVPEYVAAEAEVMGGRARACLYTEGDLSFLLPLVVRQVPGGQGVIDAISPYGYPGPVSNASLEETDFWHRACASVIASLRDQSLLTCFVRLNPLFETPLKVLRDFGEVQAHGYTVAIDLTVSDAEVWAGYRTNHRRQIRRAREGGLSLVMDDWGTLPEFERIYHETMRRVGADPSYFFDSHYFRRLHAALGDHIHLASVIRHGEMQGGGLFFERDGIVQFHLGATRDDALALQPTKLMFDEMQRWSRDRGARALHLGGGFERDGHNPLFHFKAGFSRWWLDFYTWRLVLDEARYHRYCRETVGGTTVPGDYFPAYRRARTEL